MGKKKRGKFSNGIHKYFLFLCVLFFFLLRSSTHSDDLKAQTQIRLDASNETITKYTQ